MKETLRKRLLLVLVIVSAIWLSYLTGQRVGSSTGRPRGPSAGVFVLDIHFTFKSLKDRDAFVELWRPLAKHVRLNEPGTLSYELAIADSDPLMVLIFERYKAKDDYHLHKASKPFEEFHSQLRASGIEWANTHGQSYYETGIGFMAEELNIPQGKQRVKIMAQQESAARRHSRRLR